MFFSSYVEKIKKRRNKNYLKFVIRGWWHMPLALALERQREVDL